MKKRPVYFGKDIINENLGAYQYFGHFPTYVLMRSRYCFQGGIVEWWMKFFKWSIRVKAEAFEIKLRLMEMENITLSEHLSDKNNVYALCCIPLVGLAFSIIVFILLDSVVFKMVAGCVRKLCSTPVQDILVEHAIKKEEYWDTIDIKG